MLSLLLIEYHLPQTALPEHGLADFNILNRERVIVLQPEEPSHFRVGSFQFGMSANCQRDVSCRRHQAATEKWRPRDGIYGSPKSDSEEQCPEAGNLTIKLAEKSVSGYEWGCTINRLTDTASDAIRLDATCNDYNLAQGLYPRDPKAQERTFKEIILLKRIDDTAVSFRKTLNGKFTDAAERVEYCSADVQRAYTEAVAKRGYQLPEQLSRPEQWRPRDGLYASADMNFNDPCTKSPDVIIDLKQGSILTGETECKAVDLMNTDLASISLTMTCPKPSGKQTSKSSQKKAAPEAQANETFRLRKIDDNTVFLRKSQNGYFKDEGGPVSYCPEEAQRAHAARQAKK